MTFVVRQLRMEATRPHKALDVLRWTAFLPLATLAAWVAWILVNILGRFSLGYVGVESDDLLSKFYFNTAGHAAMGGVFVYVGANRILGSE